MYFLCTRALSPLLFLWVSDHPLLAQGTPSTWALGSGVIPSHLSKDNTPGSQPPHKTFPQNKKIYKMQLFCLSLRTSLDSYVSNFCTAFSFLQSDYLQEWPLSHLQFLCSAVPTPSRVSPHRVTKTALSGAPGSLEMISSLGFLDVTTACIFSYYFICVSLDSFSTPAPFPHT